MWNPIKYIYSLFSPGDQNEPEKNVEQVLQDYVKVENDVDDAVDDIVTDNVKKQYKQPVFSYKRCNRFQEILETLQGKEKLKVPDSVLDKIEDAIINDNVDNDSLDVGKIKYYLRRFGLSHYYEHSPQILDELTGKKPPSLTPQLEQQLRKMFQQIQEPFEKVRNQLCPERLSFLSYNYVIHKFLELLDETEYLQHFPLLKSPEKLRIQDKIWSGICNELGWNFIPSIETYVD